MFGFLKKLFSSGKKKKNELRGKEQKPEVTSNDALMDDSEGNSEYQPARLKDIAKLEDNSSFRNSFVSETDLIQHFFKEFNNWINNHINLQFSRYYSSNYHDLIEEDIKKLEDKDLEVFRYQQIIEKSVKDAEIKSSSFELFTSAISMSDYTKKTLKVLKIEMDAIKGLPGDSNNAIMDIRDRVNSLTLKYNTDYDKYFRSLTSVRMRFMKAIEGYLNRIKAINEN